MDIEKELKSLAPQLTKEIEKAAASSHNEAEFRTKIAQQLENLAQKVNLNLYLREEYTLVNGRADAVYNRLIIEYEPPNSLKPNNEHRTNQHSISQVREYINGLVRRERHKPERLAGVILDGSYFIFIRNKEGLFQIDPPLKVDDYSTEYFLKLLFSLSTELALIPENLIRDFGENTNVSRKVVGNIFTALISAVNPKTKTLFEQWSLQFSEVCDYEETSRIEINSFARKFGITAQTTKPFQFFFCLHTYYATFIKILAVQVVQYYAMPKLGTDLKQAATFESNELREYLRKIENGGIFKELGIGNFIEGDFFGWYLEIWNDEIYQAFKELISTLANYSLVTLDVDPDTTRDLLKKLYQQIMPRELRHNLGEYYTPDWLAERLINMVEGGNFEGNPDKRIIDPACGSGTFLVIVIKKIRDYLSGKTYVEHDVLKKILTNVVGFDLNPLAVISARTNYLLALGDLLQHRKGEINIPIYLCDSIMTPQEGKDLFGKGVVQFTTAVGPFVIPKALVLSQYIDLLSNFLEEAVKLNLNRSQFIERLLSKIPLNKEGDNKDMDVVYALYEKLLTLEQQGINGIWARIIKNAFAPLFVGEFDYVVGNPPWVNWEHLPENYRKATSPLWIEYGLFSAHGIKAAFTKDDVSIIMTYVSLDKYLKRFGKLGFVITQSVFKTELGGKGFRRFMLANGIPIQVVHVDDMVELNPFEGASNRTSVVILQKNKPTKYPLLSYLYWRKTAKGKSIPLEASLEEVIQMTTRKQFIAEPVDEKDLTSTWITGRAKTLKAIKKIRGKSDYTAREGVNSGGANAVYWVDIVDKRTDGYIVISNITDGAKRKVESTQAAIEPDLLYPLLRARGVKRWHADDLAYIIMPHTQATRMNAISEELMKTKFPKTFMYLKRFESPLNSRKGFSGWEKNFQKNAFYAIQRIGDYTFAPFKVVWTRFAKIEAAVISKKDGKPIIPQETVTLVALESKNEAHYLAGMVNSTPFQYAAISYSQEGGKSMGSPHVLENICIPKFDSKNKLCLKIAELSEEAHCILKGNDADKIANIESELDDYAAQIWGLTKEESSDIKGSLKELMG